MRDELLKFGAGFDWITPLWAFVQDVKYGQPFQVNVPYNLGWSGNQVTDALNEKGIRTWGLMVVDETITFTVRKPQARYTLYWLERWGVLYQVRVDRLPDGKNAETPDDTSDETSDGTTVDYPETIYAISNNTNDEMEGSHPYTRGWLEYSLRKINVTADRLSGGR